MQFKSCWKLLPLALAGTLAGQMSPNLTVAPLPSVRAAKGATATVSVRATLPAGYHANSNKPTEPYLIPLTLKWSAGPLETDSIMYPKGSLEKYSFSDKPLSVVTGEFTITTKFKVSAAAQPGPAAESGTLRYQACDNKACYPPKSVPVSVVVTVE